VQEKKRAPPLKALLVRNLFPNKVVLIEF